MNPTSISSSRAWLSSASNTCANAEKCANVGFCVGVGASNSKSTIDLRGGEVMDRFGMGSGGRGRLGIAFVLAIQRRRWQVTGSTMRQSPTQVVHLAAGSRAMSDAGSMSGSCWLCGGDCARGARVDGWLSDVFTDHSRVACPSSDVVCEACMFICSRTSPVPGRPPKDGKAFGGNYRNFSHLADEHGYLNASKGEKLLIREFLAREHSAPWFAAVADSGQKHVLPFAPMNGPGRSGRVAFDERIVSVPNDQSLIAEMMALLTAGATKEELESGNYGPRAWQLCGGRLAGFEASRARERRSGWFSLALWLAQRDEEEVQRRLAAEKETKDARRKGPRTVTNTDGRGDVIDPSRVSRKRSRKRTEALGSTSGPHASGSENDRDSGGVGHGDVPESAPAESAQRELFGVR